MFKIWEKNRKSMVGSYLTSLARRCSIIFSTACRLSYIDEERRHCSRFRNSMPLACRS